MSQRPFIARTRIWTSITGKRFVVQAGRFIAPCAAEADALDRAIACGWTPIRWWKFWRWGDTPNPSARVRRAIETRSIEL